VSDSERTRSGFREEATCVVSSVLTERSRVKCEKAYKSFGEWHEGKIVKNAANEKVLPVCRLINDAGNDIYEEKSGMLECSILIAFLEDKALINELFLKTMPAISKFKKYIQKNSYENIDYLVCVHAIKWFLLLLKTTLLLRQLLKIILYNTCVLFKTASQNLY
jgi:hypothetical protein